MLRSSLPPIVLLTVVTLLGCGPTTGVRVVVQDGAEGEGEGEGEGEAGEGEGEGEAGEGEGEGEGEAVVDGPVRYDGAAHSPLTAAMVSRLRALREAHPELRDDVFAKVGASNTVNTGFATCLDGSSVDLASHADLEEVRAHFAAGNAAGTSPYDRVSAAATVGWSSFMPLRGDPRPLDVEVDAIQPAFAVVQFGTNDIQLNNITRFADDMIALTDALLNRGVIPIISTIPPRNDSASADLQVPRYGLVMRMIAEARQVPFIDLEQRLRGLTVNGLISDGIHMNTDPRGACRFDAQGLGFGFNNRNLLTLEALNRVVRSVVFSEAAPTNAIRPAVVGTGSADAPFVVDGLPFTHTSDTNTSSARARASYDCAPSVNESGPERSYTLTVTGSTTLHALVFDQGDVDVDVHILQGDHCLVRNDKEAVAAVDAGTYTIVFDTFAGDAKAGAYQAVIYAE